MAKLPRDTTLDEPLLRLKVATRKAVKAVHGTELAAELAGTRQQRISDCQLPNTPDFLRLDEAMGIEDAARGSADWPQLTRALARHHGFALLPLPGAASGEGAWHRSLAEVSRQAGEAVSVVCEALADDDQISPREIREHDIIRQVDEAIDALAQLRGQLQATAESIEVARKPAAEGCC